jgi:hypothetical protein
MLIALSLCETAAPLQNSTVRSRQSVQTWGLKRNLMGYPYEFGTNCLSSLAKHWRVLQIPHCPIFRCKTADPPVEETAGDLDFFILPDRLHNCIQQSIQQNCFLLSPNASQDKWKIHKFQRVQEWNPDTQPKAHCLNSHNYKRNRVRLEKKLFKKNMLSITMKAGNYDMYIIAYTLTDTSVLYGLDRMTSNKCGIWFWNNEYSRRKIAEDRR